MSKSKKVSAPTARGTKVPPASPRPGALTVDDRDAISAATERAKGMLTLVMATLNEDDVVIVGGVSEDADRTGAVLTACLIMREAINVIDETVHAADARQDAAATARGAR